MNYNILKNINDTITTDTSNTSFNNYIINYDSKIKKMFYNLIKDGIYRRYAERNDYNHLSKMLEIKLLDYTFKRLNEHQQKIYIFNSDYINKKDIEKQLEDYENNKQQFIKQGGLYGKQ